MFSWDLAKAAINLLKHKVSFMEACSVFADTQALEGLDIRHSEKEERRFIIGGSDKARTLTVIFTVRRHQNGNETIRIISARQTSRKERKAYAGQRN